MNSSLVLLHGALGTEAQCRPLEHVLSTDFDVSCLTFGGHGVYSDQKQPFRIERFAEELGAYLDQHAKQPVRVFGYSMGGYVAAYAALKYKNRIKSLTTLGTKWKWNPEIAAGEIQKLNPEKIEEKVPSFARLLADRHGKQQWKDVVRRTADMMDALGRNAPLAKADLEKLKIPVNVLLGDQDDMVSRDESFEVADWLPYGTFELLEDTPHPLEKVDTEKLCDAICIS